MTRYVVPPRSFPLLVSIVAPFFGCKGDPDGEAERADSLRAEMEKMFTHLAILPRGPTDQELADVDSQLASWVRATWAGEGERGDDGDCPQKAEMRSSSR